MELEHTSGPLELLLNTNEYECKRRQYLTHQINIINRHKNIINNLDHKYIFDKKIIKKFIESKKQLIKCI